MVSAQGMSVQEGGVHPLIPSRYQTACNRASLGQL